MGPGLRRDDAESGAFAFNKLPPAPVIASGAKQSIFLFVATMDCFAALAMTLNIRPRPRGAKRPRPCMKSYAHRGRGERRMPVAPAASRALGIGRTHTSKRVHRNHPTFPHAMVLTVSFALSPVTGLVCHRRLRIKSCLSPVGPTRLRKLDASVGASGPHDFAVRCNISRPLAL